MMRDPSFYKQKERAQLSRRKGVTGQLKRVILAGILRALMLAQSQLGCSPLRHHLHLPDAIRCVDASGKPFFPCIFLLLLFTFHSVWTAELCSHTLFPTISWHCTLLLLLLYTCIAHSLSALGIYNIYIFKRRSYFQLLVV